VEFRREFFALELLQLLDVHGDLLDGGESEVVFVEVDDPEDFVDNLLALLLNH
jgi:hypothetical protein